MKITFKQLYDINNQITYSVDGNALLFKMKSDDVNFEVRLKPFYAVILLDLFNNHPNPVSYANIEKLLLQQGIACTDSTRLHRKVSEIRKFLEKQNPSLINVIINTRGVGYSLPLSWKTPTEHSDNKSISFKNKKIDKLIKQLWQLIDESTALTKKSRVIRYNDIYIIDRKKCLSEVENLIIAFEKLKTDLWQQLSLHEAEWLALRIEFTLAKIKTYIGLARLSEFSITNTQWADWHENEVHLITEELIELLLQAKP